MSVPEWVKYELIQDTGSRMLPVAPIPTGVRRSVGAASPGAPHVDAATARATPATRLRTPTTRLAIWMLRRGNRSVGLVFATLLAVALGVAADWAWDQAQNGSVIFYAAWAWWAWDAVKLGAVAVALLVMLAYERLRSLA
jgi:hypothetical protein